MRRIGLERLLRALALPELRRVARAYGVQARGPRRAVVAALCARRQVDAAEIAQDLLSAAELSRVAETLGLSSSGTRGQLAYRIGRALRHLPFEEARAVARTLGLGSTKEWRRWIRRAPTDDLPRTPDGVYRHAGWRGWPDFLGYSPNRVSQGRTFRPFANARAFVRRLGLANQREWTAWATGERPDLPGRPSDIPTTPARSYRTEWRGLGDWLGTGKVANHRRAFRPFGRARAFVRALGLRSQAEWHAWCRSAGRPADIPSNPHRTYAEQWRGYGDWLGTGVVAKHLRRYRSFRRTRALARALGLRNQGEWFAWSRGGERPADVPTKPMETYREEWKGWGDFLGTGNVAPVLRRYRSFRAARGYARALGLRSAREWRAWCRGELASLGWPDRPPDIPADPARRYRGQGWVDMRDWLGTSR